MNAQVGGTPIGDDEPNPSAEFIERRGNAVAIFTTSLWIGFAAYCCYEILVAYLEGGSAWALLFLLLPAGILLGWIHVLDRLRRFIRVRATETALVFSERGGRTLTIPRESILSCEFGLERGMHPQLRIRYLDTSQRRKMIRLSRFYYEGFDDLRERLEDWAEGNE